jgi:hypothetical protein
MLRLVMESTKYTHLYHYYQHSEIGLMHIRVQTWFPFSVDVCLNGRQWLARQMDRAGIDYQQRDNCFIWIKDYAAVQELLDEQLRGDWPALMNAFLELAHPLHREITAPMVGLSYYWSASQSEYGDSMLWRRRITLYCWLSAAASSPLLVSATLIYAPRSIPQLKKPKPGARAQRLPANSP